MFWKLHLIMLEDSTRGERREERKKNQRKMKVSGTSVKRIWEVIVERARRIQEFKSK